MENLILRLKMISLNKKSPDKPGFIEREMKKFYLIKVIFLTSEKVPASSL